MQKMRFFIFIIVVAGILAGSTKLVLDTSLVKRLDNISSNLNPAIRHFSPTWRSLKKIVDIPYIASSLFRQTTLPIYKIELTKGDLRTLLNDLPNYPEQNRLYENFKQSVRGEFSSNNYHTSDAKIRYRGTSPNHWNALKKSWQVELPQKSPLNGKTEYRFFIGEDKGWIKASLWNRIGDKLGIKTLEAEPVRLFVNTSDMGVYIRIDGWEHEGVVFTTKSVAGTDDLLGPWALDIWYDRSNAQKPVREYPELVEFLTLTAKAQDQTFIKNIGKVLDVDVFLQWTFLSALTGEFNQGNYNNLNFTLNEKTHKLEPIFFDGVLSPIGSSVDVSEHRVAQRLLRYEQFQKQFEAIAREYLTDENLADDLNKYAKLTKILLPDIYSDTVKIQTNREALDQIENERNIYEHNFRALQTMLRERGNFAYRFADETYPYSP